MRDQDRSLLNTFGDPRDQVVSPLRLDHDAGALRYDLVNQTHERAVREAVRTMAEAEEAEARERLATIARAALRARQLVADLDARRTPRIVDVACSGLKLELNTILSALEPLSEEWRRVVAPEIAPGDLTACDDRGDPPLFEAES